MRLSMVMIVRDESAVIRRCLESFWDHVDEVVLCDTGSVDDTVEQARGFARERAELDKLTVGHFEWTDDFAAARTHAHSLATGDVHAFVDADEVLGGAEHLRAAAEMFAADPELGTLTTPHCALDLREATQRQLEYWGLSSRSAHLFRAPVVWQFPVWEKVLDTRREGQFDKTIWFHCKQQGRGRRDLDLALAWLDRKSEHPPGRYVMWTAVCEALVTEAHDTALQLCDRALALPDLTLRERVGFIARKAESAWELGRHAEAADAAAAAVELARDDIPSPATPARWVLALHSEEQRDFQTAVQHAAQVIAYPRHDAYARVRYIGAILLLFRCFEAVGARREHLTAIDTALEVCAVGEPFDQTLRTLRDTFAKRVEALEAERAFAGMRAIRHLSPGPPSGLEIESMRALLRGILNA